MDWKEGDFSDHYSAYYELNNDCDSHSAQRGQLASMLRRDVLDNPMDSVKCLDLGSGRGVLKDALKRDWSVGKISSRIEIFSLDIAQINSDRLFSPGENQHVRASGARLPFPRESLDYVWSNMAIDFMPREVFDEVWSVLLPGGRLFANLHHPVLTEIDDTVYQVAMGDCDLAFARYQKYGGSRNYRSWLNKELVLKATEFRKNDMWKHIFDSVGEIERFMDNGMWEVVNVEEQCKGREKWFCLTASKRIGL